MDYEKAYKDIVAKVKKAHLFAQTDSTKNVLEDILPELRESEDERIRKSIVETIKQCPDDFLNPKNRDGMLEWLEKQKEQKPNQSEEEREYVKTLKGLVSGFIRDSGGAISDVTYYQRICDWLDERHIEQKPAEWVLPEDFEEAVYKVANFISPFDSQDELRRVSHRFAEQLMSLAKKDLDKPAEWSEEDEGWFKYILEELNAYLKDYEGAAEAGMKEAIKWFKTRLKSLRPSWKPSEGDIKMLEHIIWQYETGNKNSKVMGYLPRVEELGFLKKVLSKWKN